MNFHLLNVTRRICLYGIGAVALACLPSQTQATSFILPEDILVSGYVSTIGSGGEAINQGIVVAVNPVTGLQQVVASSGLMTQPQGIAVDGERNIFIAQANNVIRIDGVTGQQTVLSSGQLLVGVTDIAINARGELYALANIPNQAPFQPATIINVDRGSGYQSLSLQSFAANNTFGQALAAAPSGDIAFMNPGGCGGACFTVNSLEGFSTSGFLGSASDIAFSNDNNLYVSLNLLDGFLPIIPDASGPGILGLGTGNLSFFSLTERAIGFELYQNNSIYAALSNQVIRIDQGTGSINTISAGGFLSGFTVTDMTIARSLPLPPTFLLLGSSLTGLVLAQTLHRRKKAA